MPSNTKSIEPISPRQTRFASDLIGRITNFGPLDNLQQEILQKFQGSEDVSLDQAKYLITGLLRCTESNLAKPGDYTLDGEFARVTTNENSGRTYAKRLTVTGTGRNKKSSWKFERGLVYQLGGWKRCTKAQSAKLPK